ncbi:flagellar export protein FliJ [Photobacterium sp. GJ3]|uniref:flagellar export protein FliJ n=1 Tax=Photobacterium sp. GJ3 TaxID=2829502 RepID=UPI001B8B3A6C|nr:flagellar export protein FliJ [Photobacterium sp. GJ3]QUJ68702.1 flagellar export protein FliJ [Photobacterium sp. GJ3]
MKGKLKAVSQLQQIAEQQRDQQGQDFARQQEQVGFFAQQLQALAVLKPGNVQQGAGGVNPLALQNSTQVNAMLNRLITHQQHEMALMHAESQRTKKALEQSQVKVKGLETVMERWKVKQRYEQAKKEQKFIEDLINARCKRRAL